MKRRDFLLYSTYAASVLAAGLGVAAPSAGAQADALFDQAFPDVDGNEQALKQWLGKPVVVNFWATWCPPCVKEMPDLEALHQSYGDVIFLGLAVDTKANVERFIEKVRVTYPLLLVGPAGISLMRTMGNKPGGLPFTVIFDEHGQTAETVLGQIDPGDLEQTIKALV